MKKTIANQHKTNGFSLIECTVYLAVFSFISMLFLGVASRAQLKFMSVSSDQESLLRQVVALDLLRRDLMSASQKITDWDIQNNQTVFKKLTLTDKNLPQFVYVSWFIGTQGLMRAHGEYDFVKHQWINKSSCIVCKAIKEISFVLQNSFDQKFSDENARLRGVCVVYKKLNSGVGDCVCIQNFFVRFRNGAFCEV